MPKKRTGGSSGITLSRSETLKAEVSVSPKKPPRSVQANARVVAAATLLSRILGLVREMGMTAVFGMGPAADGFFFAFAIPNSFRRVFGEGALSAAFLPTFVQTREAHGLDRARRLFGRCSGTLGVILSCLVALLAVCFLIVGRSGLLPERGPVFELASLLTIYTLPICLVALAMAALNAMGHFLSPALSPVMLNLVWIAALWWVVPAFGSGFAAARALAVCILFAGSLQLALQIPALRRHRLVVAPSFSWRDAEIRKIRNRMIPVLFGLAIFQINDLIDKCFAWLVVSEAGGVTALHLGNRLLQFPLALVGIAVGTAAFPVFASLWASKKRSALAFELENSLGVVLFFGVPASAGLAAVSPQLVDVLFRHGAFSAEDTARTVAVTLIYSSAVWILAVQAILTRFFQAVDRRDIPVRVGMIAVVVNLCLDFCLVWSWGEVGLATATCVAAMVQTSLLFLYVESAAQITPKILLHVGWRVALCSGLCGLAAILGGRVFAKPVFGLLLGTAAGSLAYLLCARVLFGKKRLVGLLHGRRGARGGYSTDHVSS